MVAVVCCPRLQHRKEGEGMITQLTHRMIWLIEGAGKGAAGKKERNTCFHVLEKNEYLNPTLVFLLSTFLLYSLGDPEATTLSWLRLRSGSCSLHEYVKDIYRVSQTYKNMDPRKQNKKQLKDYWGVILFI